MCSDAVAVVSVQIISLVFPLVLLNWALFVLHMLTTRGSSHLTSHLPLKQNT